MVIPARWKLKQAGIENMVRLGPSYFLQVLKVFMCSITGDLAEGISDRRLFSPRTNVYFKLPLLICWSLPPASLHVLYYA